ncbi:MAG TPA: hypothetical protein VIO38_08620 [Rariglobus sp.]
MIVFSVAPRRKSGSRSGFALLITVTLLAFLVLLLVSLASLTRVETQVAANNRQISQARQNALMALNIALGELQKYAGPDQRTTARSDMDAALVNTSGKSGRWIGVYGSGVSANYADIPSVIASKIAADAASGPANGSQARLLNWLVSGNENTAFDPGSAVAADGRITAAPSAFTYQPSDPVANIAGGVPTVAGKEARLLVGPGTVGASPNDYVAAPLVNIDAAAGQVPGLSGAATIGRYAWWVGDENAKARINLPLTEDAAKLPQSFVNASRAAVELVDGVNVEGAAAMAPANAAANRLVGYDPSVSATASAIPRLLNTNQLEMLGINAAAVTALTTARKYRFHDLTSASSSVLSDTYAGGLKKDLSALLAAKGSSSAPLGGGLNATDFLFTPEPAAWSLADNSFGVPTWGQLRSFASSAAQSDGKLTPQVFSATQMGVNPVLTYMGMGFAYVTEGNPGDAIRLAVYPSAVLWNPYTMPIRGAKYEYGWRRRFSGQIQLQASDNPNDPQRATPKTYRWSIKETRDFGRGATLVTGGVAPHADGSINVSGTGGTPVVYEGNTTTYLRFVIDASDVELQPGESMIFTLARGGQDYYPPGNSNQTELKKGLRPATSASAMLPAASWVEQGDVLFRVAINGTGSVTDPNRTLYSPATTNQVHFTGGEGETYLGEVSSAVPSGYGDDLGKGWYQSFARLFPGGGGTPPTLQGGVEGAELSPASSTGPVFMTSISMLFSGSAMRWIAQANPRALVNTRNRLDGANAPMTSGGGLSAELTVGFTTDSDGRASSGLSLDAGLTRTNTTLFELRPADQPLMSLGQLQHANLSLVQTYPAYPLGNSLADYRFSGTLGDRLGSLVRTDGTDIQTPAMTYFSGAANYVSFFRPVVWAFYDLSYLLNRAMWDRYFISTVPHAGTGKVGDTEATAIPEILPNPRLQGPVTDDLRDADRAAAGLMLAGGFNINSTSEQAWRAVLGGINKLVYDPVTPSNAGSPLQAALPRFSKPTQAPDANSAAWQGYRQLTPVQIAQLARNIVAEVRNRGPFVSMGDFVNRRLLDNPATTTPATNTNADERYKGAIQNAIDATVTGTTAVNVGTANVPNATAPFTVNGYSPTGGTYTDAKLMVGGPVKIAPYGAKAAFLPQFLTQADVLSAVGSGLSARSDTFMIRACGETVNPLGTSTDADYVTGRAWCEAIVQRVVEPVRRKNANAASADYNEPAAASSGQPDFGRRFKIISFRWLSSDEI